MNSIPPELSLASVAALKAALQAPIVRSTVNPGIVGRLLKKGLIKLADLPSPHRTVKKNVQHIFITPAGRRALLKAKMERA